MLGGGGEMKLLTTRTVLVGDDVGIVFVVVLLLELLAGRVSLVGRVISCRRVVIQLAHALALRQG